MASIHSHHEYQKQSIDGDTQRIIRKVRRLANDVAQIERKLEHDIPFSVSAIISEMVDLHG